MSTSTSKPHDNNVSERPSTEAVAIRLSDVRFAYDLQHPVLRGVNLEIKAGEITALLGNNGAGKTTTFKILSGLLRPDHGAVEIDGVSVLAHPTDVRTRLAYLPEQSLLYPCLSGLENMNMFGLLWGVDKAAAESRSRELMQAIGLWPVRNQWVKSYSTGMKQKLSLCVALLHQPRVLLMDEPFTGLDLDSALWARAHLQQFAQRGGAILLATHIPELASAFASSLAIIRDGSILAHSSREYVERGGGIIPFYQRAHRTGPT